jgi:hypothetical protein
MSLLSIHTIDNQDSLQDVVKRVVWQLNFFYEDDPSVDSSGVVETYLDTESLSADGYTPYDELTQTTILGWALDKQGGSSFMETLLDDHHRDNLVKARLDSSLSERNPETIPEQ